MSKERNSGIVLGLLAGAAIGSLLGVLFAPDKGCETRKRVRRKAEELTEDALEHYGEFSEKAKHQIEHLVADAKNKYEDLKHKYEEYKQKHTSSNEGAEFKG